MSFKIGDTIQIRKPKRFELYRGTDVAEMYEHSQIGIVDDYETITLDTPEKVEEFNRMPQGGDY